VTYFNERVGAHPDRIKNLYFVYAATLKAVSIMEPVLAEQNYTSGIKEYQKQDQDTLKQVNLLLDAIRAEDCEMAFQEKSIFSSHK
jgi:hypothetical protein